MTLKATGVYSPPLENHLLGKRERERWAAEAWASGSLPWWAAHSLPGEEPSPSPPGSSSAPQGPLIERAALALAHVVYFSPCWKFILEIICLKKSLIALFSLGGHAVLHKKMSFCIFFHVGCTRPYGFEGTKSYAKQFFPAVPKCSIWISNQILLMASTD